jgi:glycerol-3-phosphate cytidylyltransferase
VTAERGLAIGVFDLFHVGHLRYLQCARDQCQELIVAVTPDLIAEQVKGRKPVVPEGQRMEIVQGLGFVAEARLLPSTTEDTQAAAIWISSWEIQHVIAGGGWRGSARWERLIPELAKHGVTVEFASHTDEVSTTQLIETIRQRFGVERAG